jgi:hypothetical protein
MCARSALFLSSGSPRRPRSCSGSSPAQSTRAPSIHGASICPWPPNPAPAPLPSLALHEEVGAEDVEQIHVNDARRQWARRCQPVQEEHDGDGVLLGDVEEVVDVVSRCSWAPPPPAPPPPPPRDQTLTRFNRSVPQSRTSPPTRCPLPSVSDMTQLTSIEGLRPRAVILSRKPHSVHAPRRPPPSKDSWASQLLRALKCLAQSLGGGVVQFLV